MEHGVMIPTGRAGLLHRPEGSQSARLLLIVLISVAVRGLSLMAAPALDQFFPILLRPGTSNIVNVVGKIEPWPPRFWCDDSTLKFVPSTNKGEVYIQVPPEAPPGPRAVRAYDDTGASNPRLLLIGDRDHLLEKEPNDQFREPQPIESLPANIQGRLEKTGDVDCFALRLEKGQTLIASLQSYTLASPVDAVLRLVDTRGIQLALNHDDGRTFDPELFWTADHSDTYVIQVFGFPYPADSDVRFTGNPKCVYLLSLTKSPWIQWTDPIGFSTNSTNVFDLHVLNCKTPLVKGIAPQSSSLSSGTALIRFDGFSNSVKLPAGSGPEWHEQDLAGGGKSNTTPFAVTGTIGARGEEDRYSFIARKGQSYVLEVQSAALGAHTDLWLKLQDEKGNELARNDDAKTEDPRLEWTAPADGLYSCLVGDTLDRGTNNPYRLSIEPAGPAIKITALESALKLDPGKTNSFKLSVTRSFGHTNELTISATPIPAGVSLEPVKVPEKSGELELKFVCQTNAPATNLAFRLTANGPGSARPIEIRHELTTSGVNNGVPNGFQVLLLDSVIDLWMTVPPAATNSVKETKSAK